MGDDSSRGVPPPAGEDGEDCISRLPDELLHEILVCLGSARAAAQTSVLSRRWRRVWTTLPELFLCAGQGPVAASFLDTVDAALAASTAPTLKRLRISVCCPYQGDVPSVTADRVALWLRLASQRVAGDIFLELVPDERWSLDLETTADAGEEEEEEAALELPVCESATSITLITTTVLRLAGGVFTALTELVLHWTRVDGRELSDLVSTQCPRLKKLDLLLVVLVAASDVTIHSNSLHSLGFFVRKTQRLEVVAPKLEDLSLWCLGMETHISAPSLANVTWSGEAYDPRWHHFAHICRRLRVLNLGRKITPTPLMEKFNEVDKQTVHIEIPKGIAGYQCFMNLTNKLPKCETIGIGLECNEHGLAPAILHLFRACNSIKKLSINFSKANHYASVPVSRYSCPLACPCRLEESSMIEDIALGSLGEVEIDYFEGSQDEMEFVQQLSICNAPVLERLVINYSTTYPPPPLTKEVCEKVRSMCRPNLKVEFYAVSKGRRVLFD